MPYFTPTQIRDIYIEKCKCLGFSNNLKKPTEARIRNACINTYHKKNSSSDKWILRNFLGVTEEKDLTVALKEDVGKFRPVVNFLKNKTEDPRDETIELIAWLIGFNAENNDDEFQEPKETGQLPPEKEEPEKKFGNEVDLNDETTEDEASDDDVSTLTEHEKTKSTSKTQTRVVICVFILFFGGGGFLYWQDKSNRTTITEEEKCMYWNGDTYEAVACNLETSSAKIPLDTAVLHQLKKINEPDTLTQHSIDKVWYGKVNGKPEFYTAAGNHPLDANKRLMPLTDYMLKKYVSYHRYQLKILIWSVGGVLLIAILMFITFVYNKKHNSLIFNHPS